MFFARERERMMGDFKSDGVWKGFSCREGGERLDGFLSGTMGGFSRSYIQKLIKNGLVTVNGRTVKANYRARTGDTIKVCLPPLETDKDKALPEDIPLNILYEDGDILIADKPKGMVVHPAPGHQRGTLVNALLYHCGGKLSEVNGPLRPGIVHRLDKDTSGLIVVCKTDRAHISLAAQFKAHEADRKYRAIVIGNIKEDCGAIDMPVGRRISDRKKMSVHPAHGKSAVTRYKVLERFGSYTYVECTLETGRTHQIRVHMAGAGHPVLGDAVYGPRKCPFKLNGQALHAQALKIKHPVTGEYMEFEAPLPDYFVDLLEKLRKKFRARPDGAGFNCNPGGNSV